MHSPIQPDEKFWSCSPARESLPATQIYANFSVSPPAISQHLKVLREANLVKMEKHAQQRIYQINPEAVLELEDWSKQLAQHWNQRLDVLDEFLKDEKKKEKEINRKDV